MTHAFANQMYPENQRFAKDCILELRGPWIHGSFVAMLSNQSVWFSTLSILFPGEAWNKERNKESQHVINQLSCCVVVDEETSQLPFKGLPKQLLPIAMCFSTDFQMSCHPRMVCRPSRSMVWSPVLICIILGKWYQLVNTYHIYLKYVFFFGIFPW